MALRAEQVAPQHYRIACSAGLPSVWALLHMLCRPADRRDRHLLPVATLSSPPMHHAAARPACPNLTNADLDHHNPQLRESLIDWLNWLKTDIGFEGWVSGSFCARPCFLVASLFNSVP